ncbi:MAG: RluA family pseudouridine synthase [Pseudomonadota bacterium]|nr:RluA family pseudouridine synthase [Pseudomonadota bacterium]
MTNSRNTRKAGTPSRGQNRTELAKRPVAAHTSRPSSRPPKSNQPAHNPEQYLQQALEQVSEQSIDAPSEAVGTDQDWQQVTWFVVTEYQEGQRLDNYLVTRLKGVPKTRIYRLIREGEVRVNKGRVRADTRLQIGDQVRVAPIRRHVHQAKAEAVISDTLAQGLAERIVYEDDGLIVLDKPSGIAVHGGSGVEFGVIEALRQALGKSYLELIHRIDRDTSGLLMISKKRSVLKKLQDHLRDGKIRKTYQAIVKGQVLLDKQRINAPLLRYELPNGERRVRVASDGKPSQTDWVVKERLQGATLVEASPLTGRTHQIRVHGLSIGHALLGDDKYGHEQVFTAVKPRRLCLHAARLQIPEYPEIVAPMPDDMQSVLTQLRQLKKPKDHA